MSKQTKCSRSWNENKNNFAGPSSVETHKFRCFFLFHFLVCKYGFAVRRVLHTNRHRDGAHEKWEKNSCPNWRTTTIEIHAEFGFFDFICGDGDGECAANQCIRVQMVRLNGLVPLPVVSSNGGLFSAFEQNPLALGSSHFTFDCEIREVIPCTVPYCGTGKLWFQSIYRIRYVNMTMPGPIISLFIYRKSNCSE